MKKLLILLIFIGVLLMFKNINAIIQDSIGNIVYRGNVVTGIVAKDNGDKSYDVFISESEKAYPKIFTLAENPNLEVGDKVRILYKNGCKELPIILPPTISAILRRYALICYTDTLQLFDMDGILLKSIPITGWAYGSCAVTMDSQGNIYVDEAGKVIKKYDSNLNLLVTQNIEDTDNWITWINMGSDGYLYSLESLASGTNIKKRSTTDLTIQDVIPICATASPYYDGGFCLDSSGNFYVYNDTNDKVEKYSSAGAKLAERSVGTLNEELAGCGVLGSYVYFVRSEDEIIYLPLSLSTYTVWDILPSAFAYGICVADNHLIMSGWDADGDGATAKYDSSRNLIWQKKLTGTDYGYKAGGYNF